MGKKPKSFWERCQAQLHRIRRWFSGFWYQTKCWAWHRYRTVKPASLEGHGWIDRDELMLHCAFQCLLDFVDNEDPFRVTDFDADPQHQHVKKEILELYSWWKDVYLKEIYPCNLSQYEAVNAQFHRLIEIRGYLWT